jgi:hypothetical protein
MEVHLGTPKRHTGDGQSGGLGRRWGILRVRERGGSNMCRAIGAGACAFSGDRPMETGLHMRTYCRGRRPAEVEMNGLSVRLSRLSKVLPSSYEFPALQASDSHTASGDTRN